VQVGVAFALLLPCVVFVAGFRACYALGIFSKRLLLQTMCSRLREWRWLWVLGLLGLLGSGVWCMRYMPPFLSGRHPRYDGARGPSQRNLLQKVKKARFLCWSFL
jgi:hypothetical protein